MEKPADMVLGTSLLARAQAGAGQTREFARASRRLEALLATHQEHEAAARWNLAEGQRAAGMLVQAEANARTALELAMAARDTETERFVRTLLDQLQAETSPPPVAEPPSSYVALVATLVARIRKWNPKRRGRSRSVPRQEWAA
jgi:hypothetical protein